LPQKPATKPALRIVRRTTTPAWWLRRFDELRADGQVWGDNRWRQVLQPYLRVVK